MDLYRDIELNYQAAKKPTHELAAESSKTQFLFPEGQGASKFQTLWHLS